MSKSTDKIAQNIEEVLEEQEEPTENIIDENDISTDTSTASSNNVPISYIPPALNPDSPITNMDMMKRIAEDKQTLEDIRNLTSTKVTDQLKVFLVTQARNDLMRIVKLTQFLDTLESRYMDKVNKEMSMDKLTLQQYANAIDVITTLLTRANDTVSKVLRDDSLMTILNTTIYNNDSAVQTTSVIANLKDAQSRERVRSIINTVIQNTRMKAEEDVYEVQSEYASEGTEEN